MNDNILLSITFVKEGRIIYKIAWCKIIQVTDNVCLMDGFLSVVIYHW